MGRTMRTLRPPASHPSFDTILGRLRMARQHDGLWSSISVRQLPTLHTGPYGPYWASTTTLPSGRNRQTLTSATPSLGRLLHRR